ncbi:LysR family transcriptional regulator [Roseiarcus fermentans]|nr:LysR family transcriptional regulator [Roseiarcus fermentans]
MSDFDWSDLDARLLRLLVAIAETGSVTGAAQKLGVTQSAVSHLAGKLRQIVGDPLFVKSGRGIVATARAEALAVRARDLLRDLERFAHCETFDPARWRTTFVIAANDLQRDALLPGLVAALRQRAPGVALRIVPSDVPTAEMLRDERCHLIISPRPPQGADIMQKRLFQDRYRVFYDPERRAAPSTRDDYLAADHVTVVYEPRRALDLDAHLATSGVQRRFVVTVPSFAGVPAFLRGGDLVATAPSLLRFGPFQGLASAPPPVACPPLPMFLIWSRRDHDDPAHRWMRAQVEAAAKPVGARARGSAASARAVDTERRGEEVD